MLAWFLILNKAGDCPLWELSQMKYLKPAEDITDPGLSMCWIMTWLRLSMPPHRCEVPAPDCNTPCGVWSWRGEGRVLKYSPCWDGSFTPAQKPLHQPHPKNFLVSPQKKHVLSAHNYQNGPRCAQWSLKYTVTNTLTKLEVEVHILINTWNQKLIY